MDWEKLKIFRAVANEGSFTKAADTLRISQSALSRQISNLEYEIKVKLFHRHSRGLRLTSMGNLLYNSAGRIFDELLLFETQLRQDKEKATGLLTLSTTTGLGSVWLTPLLKEFMEIYPEIELILNFNDYESDLSHNENDMAICLRRPLNQDLIQCKLFEVHVHSYASKSYVEEFGAPKTIDELHSENHRVLSFGPNIPSHMQPMNYLINTPNSKNQFIKPRLRVNTLYGLKRAVDAGIGIACYPDYLSLVENSNVRVLDKVLPPVFDTYLVYTRENMSTKRAQLFRDFLLEKRRRWSY